MGILNLEELKKQIKEGTFTSLADVENDCKLISILLKEQVLELVL